MVIGVAIGAAIYGYMPTDLLAKVAGRDNPFAVIIVALIGMQKVNLLLSLGVQKKSKAKS